MDKLTGLLLGPPRVLLNDEVVNLPFKQAEALLYYLLVEHEVSRTRLLWEEPPGPPHNFISGCCAVGSAPALGA